MTQPAAGGRSPALEAVFKPVQPPTTFEETVERLGTAIRLGLLPPGTRLPSERDLADQLGISRSTLRQALTTLVQSGHLLALRGRSGGTFVAEEPPLGRSAGGPPLGEEARAVLDYALERPAQAAGHAPAPRGHRPRVRLMSEHCEGTEHILAALMPDY